MGSATYYYSFIHTHIHVHCTIHYTLTQTHTPHTCIQMSLEVGEINNEIHTPLDNAPVQNTLLKSWDTLMKLYEQKDTQGDKHSQQEKKK